MVVKISAKNIYITDSKVYGTASVTTSKGRFLKTILVKILMFF